MINGVNIETKRSGFYRFFLFDKVNNGHTEFIVLYNKKR